MADLAAALAALSDALDAAAGIVSVDDLAPIAEVASAAEKRHGFLGDTVVVALAGGTGSGKSSLLNALAGADVSAVGAVRPTTGEPLAWIPANPEPGLVRLLDDLGLQRRVGHHHHLPVAVIDLPDYDSVEFEHRATVEALIPRVDAVIWVLDPQKYSDRALHRDYLVPLAGYGEQFLFVLNQVDRLDETGLAAVLGDLARRLASEGFDAPRIVTTAARPVSGGPRGIESMVEEIGVRFETKRTAHAKLLEDVRRAHDGLVEAAGLSDHQDSSAQDEWETAKQAAVGGLADLVSGPAMAEQAERVGERLATARAAGPLGRLGAVLRRSRLGKAFGAAPDEVKPGEWWAQPGLERVLGGLGRTVTDVSTDLGGQLGRGLRADLTPENLDTAVRASVEGARHGVGELGPPAPKKWWGFVGVVQLALFAALVVGIAWVWVDGVDRGEVPWNLILIGGSVVLSTLLGLATRASGRRAGRRRATVYRSDVEQALAAQMQEGIGARVARALAARSRLAASLERLEDAAAGVDDTE
jgi:GTP-binding protein EngB required for normal cell division